MLKCLLQCRKTNRWIFIRLLNRNADISNTSAWAKSNKCRDIPTNVESIPLWPLMELKKKKTNHKKCQDYHLYTESFDFQFSTAWIISLMNSTRIQDIIYQISSKWAFWAISLRFKDKYWQELFEHDIVTEKKMPKLQLQWHKYLYMYTSIYIHVM